ncbi:transmembrane protein, putative [Medicago truncatula]|uniref:Transmembrane protein, putative n=1 Tax=Medicago truncatula TaxID=3880 RepID=G7I2N5_MEDTR|nr:transmembrane protein, putative [Medicago truncatula]
MTLKHTLSFGLIVYDSYLYIGNSFVIDDYHNYPSVFSRIIVMSPSHPIMFKAHQIFSITTIIE